MGQQKDKMYELIAVLFVFFFLQIFEPVNFDDIKYGGCQNICDVQLHCGHHCTLVCHTNAFDHFSECQCVF